MSCSEEEHEDGRQVNTGRVTWQHPPLYLQTQKQVERWVYVQGGCTLHMLHVALLLMLHTHTQPHVQMDQKSWLGNEGKWDMPAPTDALLSVFWRVFFSLLLKSMGFCPQLFFYVWHSNPLPFWQCLFITSFGVRGPGASGTWVEGLTSLEWLCALNAYPLGLELH